MSRTLSDCVHSSTLELLHCCSSTLNGDPQFSTQNWVCILEFQNPTFTKLVSSFTSSVLAAGNPWAPPKHAWGHKLNMHVNPSQGSLISWKVLDWWFSSCSFSSSFDFSRNSSQEIVHCIFCGIFLKWIVRVEEEASNLLWQNPWSHLSCNK
jgi:hypothetical protein